MKRKARKNCIISAAALSALPAAAGLLRSSVAWAQAAQPPPDNIAANSTSAGTLIAAVLEQIGYHAQSQVLTQLGEHITVLAALMYLCVLVSALLTAGMLGSYRPFLWILIGPPMFYFASGISVGDYSNTVAAAQVHWRFGAFDDAAAENERDAVLERSESAREPGPVSFLFHKYNELISELVQLLIGAITNDELEAQMMFMARQRTMEDLFGARITHPGIDSLAAYFMAHCSNEIAYARLLALGNSDRAFCGTPEWEMARHEYCRLFNLTNKPFVPGPWQTFVLDAGLMFGQNTQCTLTNISETEYTENLISDYAVTCCADMWQWLLTGARYEIQRHAELSAISNIPSAAYLLTGTETWNSVIRQIRQHLSSYTGHAAQNNQCRGDPCPAASGANLEQGSAQGEDMAVLANIFAGYLVVNSTINPPAGELMSRVQSADHGIHSAGTQQFNITNPIQKQAILRRQSAHQFATARRYEAFMLLNLIPYLQGLLLYVLSVTYPFFALLLVLPGQAGGFFLWMALWAWAKSWDVGWALIMVADNILWELMPRSSFINPEQPMLYTSPVSLNEIAFRGDAAYSLSFYWLLLTSMVSGVPILSAHVVLGAKKAVAGVLLLGLNEFASQLASGAQDYIGTSQVRAYTMARNRQGAEALERGALTVLADRLQQNEWLNWVFGPGVIGSILQGQMEHSKMIGDAKKTVESGFLGAAHAAIDSLTGSKKKDQFIDQFLKRMEPIKNGPAPGSDLVAHAAKLRLGTTAAYWGKTLESSELGQTLSTLIKGTATPPEHITKLRNDSLFHMILYALSMQGENGAGNVKPQDFVANPALAQDFHNIYRMAMVNYLHGVMHRNLGELMMLYGGPAAAGAGYNFGGFFTAAEFFRRIVDASANTQQIHFLFQHQAATLDMRYQQNLLAWSAYSLNNNPLWLDSDLARAYVSVNRGEWFFMQNPPLDSFWAYQQLRLENELYFLNLHANFSGSNAAGLMDLLSGMAEKEK